MRRTTEENSSAKVTWLIRAAKHSRHNAKHWFRYLRKEIVNDKIIPAHEDIKKLLDSDELTIFQKISLKRAMTVGTPTYEYVASLNKPAKLTYYNELMRRMKKRREEQGKNEKCGIAV